MTLPLPSRISVLLAGLAVASLVACSSASVDGAARGDENDLVADAASMNHRPDGNWDVVCKDGRQEVATTADILADKVCGGLPPQVCIAQCSSRHSNGNCETQAADFCGPAATCVAQCASRYPSGTCEKYTADFCGPVSACVPQCSARFPSSTCEKYTTDFCAAAVAPAAPVCVPRCTARFPSGTCEKYGADSCAAGATAPTCIKACAAWYSNGNCETYGPDLCQ